MSDKPETEGQSSSETPSAGVVRKAKNAPPSFDDILASAGEKKAEKEQPKVEPKKAPSGPPSFDDILAKASQPPPPVVRQAPPPRRDQQQRSSGPRPETKKEEFKMPVVVRKITLPLPQSSAPTMPKGAGDKAERESKKERGTWRRERTAAQEDRQHEAQQEQVRTERAEQPERGPQPMQESVYAQPTAEETGDFAALFLAEQAKKPKRERLHPGSKVTAKVAHVGSEVAFLDMGGKGEGIIDLRELRNDAGELVIHEGETIEGWVLSVGEGSVVVTRAIPKGAGREVLETAMQAGAPVEGLVTAVNKGGLEVDLGGTRAFCPASQIDVRFVGDTAAFVGQRLQFKVVEMKGGNAILSRRALLEVERAEKAKKLRETLSVGQSLEGVVVGVREFGAFVDLGGIEGLVHVSELSHARVAHAQDAVKVGQKVKVQVLRMDAPKAGEPERVALSLKALEQDPWDAARPQLEVNAKMQGKVMRLQPFGAFVELFPGVDGLVHVSALSDKRVNHPREVVKEGETIWVQIESIDDAGQRVALRRITDEEAASSEPVPARGHRSEGERGGGERAAKTPGAPQQKRSRVGDVVDAVVEKCEQFGVFVTWDNGAQKGLVPNGELGTERGSDNKRTNPPGTAFKAYISDLDDRGRFRLSKVAAEAALGRQEYEQYQRNQKQAGKGFGTLGDLLRAKLAQK